MGDAEKYSQKYFEDRITQLRIRIKDSLPTLDKNEVQSFVGACKCLETAYISSLKSQDLLNELKKEQASDSSQNDAQDLVDTCTFQIQNCIDSIMSCSSSLLSTVKDGMAQIDEKSLLECTILVQATPKLLASWISKDTEEHTKLLDSFLSDINWMKQMVVAGGASDGNYGEAIKIHRELLMAIANSQTDGCTEMRHMIALAVATQLATPIQIFHKEDTFVDPITRFWHYVHAYENHDLDPAFGSLSVWEQRLCVDCNADDHELVWAREYLKAYRPDQIRTTSDQWRYLYTVRTDLGYRNPEHEYSTFKEMISAGGKCGPRAFFGRFICKAWGTPTWGVKQPGHAALSRWMPSGWQVCMGAAFKFSSWRDNRYGGTTRRGEDFFEETEARRATSVSEYYCTVSLLECLAESLGETIEEQFVSSKLWRSLALAQRKKLASEARKKTGKPQLLNMTSTKNTTVEKTRTTIRVGANLRSIIIPAENFIDSSDDATKVIVMTSFKQGNQIHLESDAFVVYRVPDETIAGVYLFTMLIVNIHQRQEPVEVSVGDDEEFAVVSAYTIQIPYTEGRWYRTPTTEISVEAGNFIRITRNSTAHGLTIKYIQLDAHASKRVDRK